MFVLKWNLHNTESHYIILHLYCTEACPLYSVLLLFFSLVKLQSWGDSWSSPSADNMMITEDVKQACCPNDCLGSVSSLLLRTDQRELSRQHRKWHIEHWSYSLQLISAGITGVSVQNTTFSHTHIKHSVILTFIFFWNFRFSQLRSILKRIKMTSSKTQTAYFYNNNFSKHG